MNNEWDKEQFEEITNIKVDIASVKSDIKHINNDLRSLREDIKTIFTALEKKIFENQK